nr:hypothetical protein [uncultured Mucilaginibacter sp.]
MRDLVKLSFIIYVINYVGLVLNMRQSATTTPVLVLLRLTLSNTLETTAEDYKHVIKGNYAAI